MSVSPTSTTTVAPAASQNPYQAALAHNKAALQRETEATQELFKETITAQQVGMTALQDENALLRAQLEDARREATRAKADLDAARVASAAMGRQVTSQQEELTRLRPAHAILQTMIATTEALKDIPPESWPEWNPVFHADCTDVADILWWTTLVQKRKEDNLASTGTYIPTPEHWRPILAAINKAKSQ